MKILQICGYSNSGKTTVVKAILQRLSQQYRVAVLKSIHQPSFIVDAEGKDTQQFAQLGADPVIASGPNQTAIMHSSHVPLPALLQYVSTDWVLLEGFSAHKYPRIVCAKTIEEIAPFLTAKTIAISGIVGNSISTYEQFNVHNNKSESQMAELVEQITRSKLL